MPDRLPAVRDLRPHAALRARAGNEAVDAVAKAPDKAADRVATGACAPAPPDAAASDPEAVERDRRMARKILDGLPTAPRATVARDPANSHAGSSLTDAARARRLMKGYTGGEEGALMRLLGKLLPWLFKRERTPAFERLAPAEREKFLTVAREADAAGQLALHRLLVEGRLKAPVLDELARLSAQRVAAGIDRRQLVSQALQELADPVTITQAARGTCTATSIQMLVALTKPALYLQMLGGLASPDGRFKLPGGASIARERDWDYQHDGGRSIPSRLIQPAFMELGNGELDYDNELDADRVPCDGTTRVAGLEATQSAEVIGQLAGGGAKLTAVGPNYRADVSSDLQRALDANIQSPSDWLMLAGNEQVIDAASQDAIVAHLREVATPSTPVYTTIVFAPEGALNRTVFHAVLVTGVKDGHVTYMNPWGREERVPVPAFKRSLVSILAELGPDA